jgi:limonene-1,2-epoxide hydrolase
MASALTQSVIPATEVGSTDYVTYENDAVAVAETGYYHFGIHAISDADMFRLMVANFLVEAGVEATAPAAVTDLAVAQTPEKLEAVVSFKAPTKTVGGADLTDLTKIDVLRDGKVIKSLGGAEPISWDASAQGYENAQDVAAIDFGGGFTATLDGGGNTNTPKYYTSGTALRMYAKNSMTLKGTAIKKVVFTFKDKNVLEANVGTLAIDGMTGTWTGNADEIVFTVTDGSGNQARIQKIEIEGAAAGLTPGAEYSYVDAEGLTVGNHVYQVIPYNTSGVGVKSEEKSIFISVSLEAPYTFDFSQNLLDLFNVIDNNEDGKTWLWSSSNGAYYPYHGTNAADDYLITLPFNLKAGKRYNVIVNAKGSASYPERFEVKAGKEATVAGLTEQVIAPTDLNTGEFDDYEGVFAPEEDGLYYFAIHAISDADMLNLQVKTLAIELAPELTAPAAVADLTATAGAEGALEATLAFTAPSKDIKGDALTGNVDVKIYRDNELVNTLEGVAAGAAASWKDTEVENGTTYTYYVVAANESGDGLKSEKVKVFVGEDAFGTVENIQITGSTASTISFSWDPVTGANGGYVNAAAAKYAIVSTHVETVLFWQVLVIDEILATVTGETSATVNYDVNAGDQGYKYFGVLAYKEDTELPAAGDEYAGGYTYALVGAPYELPMFESFTGKTMHYLWDSNAQLIVDEVSSDDDGVAVDLLADEAGIVTFESGKININGTANPTLLFNAKSPNISKLYVYASKNGGEMSPVAELDLTEDYQTFKVSLANLAANANFIQFALVAQYTTPYTVDDEGNLVDLGDYYTLDEIRVMDLFEYNLVADIKAPKSVVAGQKAKVVATVTNYGENAAKDYTVTVKAGENVLTTVIGSDELAPFAKDEIEVEYETSIFDEAGDVTLTVDVDYENELNPDDNTASTIITVKEPTAGAPASLAAVDKGAEGVELTWAMPAASRAADAVTEDFEDTDVFEPFSLGGITAENHNGAFGDWKLYDGNGITVYGFNGLQFPNNYQPAAWQVFTTVGDGAAFADNYPANSGDQYLISFCPAEENNAPAADHWLISPELSGAAQTISFFARIITAQYGPETFEVWASTTDDNVESFTKVADYSTEAVEWTEFTADLPAGAKYFAIRHTSVDIFGLLIDDVTFAAAGATAPVPTSFNIYFEKDKVASVEGDKTTYTVAVDKLTAGEHTFAVTAVYATGAESKPVTATVTVTTDIRQIAADGKAVDIYSVDGKLVRSQATSLDGLKGLYIVDGKKIMVK